MIPQSPTKLPTPPPNPPSDLSLPPSPIYRLFQFGSAECDQFEIPNDDSFESRRPIEQTYFISSQISIHQISCGALHTLLLTTTGKIYSWGCNDDGALGRSTKESESNVSSKESYPGLVPLETPIDMISAGDSHSVACNSKNGVVYLWGVYRNTIGGNMCQPHREPIRWGEEEFRKQRIDKVLSGCNHSLILSDERVYAWGDPDTCVLGRMPLARRKFTQGLYIEALRVKNVVDIYTGGYHSFVKTKKNLKNKETKEKEEKSLIFGWGLNNYGQLGIGTTENTFELKELEFFRNIDIADIQGGEDFTIVLTKEGDVYSFGRCDDGQLGLGEDWEEKVNKLKREKEAKVIIQEEPKPEAKEEHKQKKFEYVTFPIKVDGLEKIDRIFSGSCYNYAISRVKNQVYSWGSGDHYVLGTGKEDQEYAPFTIKPNFYKLEEVVDIKLGGQHVTLITSNVANGWKLPDLEPNVTEVEKIVGKTRGRKPKINSKSKSPSKSMTHSQSKEKEKAIPNDKEEKNISKDRTNKKKEESKKVEETLERNEKKRKLKDNIEDSSKKSLKKTKKN